MKDRYPHAIECAIHALAHGSAACEKLGKFLVEQQRPDFQAQDHLFGEAAHELKSALKWSRRGPKRPKE